MFEGVTPVGTLVFLIVFPLIAAALLLVARTEMLRGAIVYGASAFIAAASLWLIATNIGTPGVYFEAEAPLVDLLLPLVSVAVCACIMVYAVRYKNRWAGVLAIIQLVLSLLFEVPLTIASDSHVHYNLYFDSLSLLMVFIIGIVGCGICVYALGYMKDFQKHHANDPDRRPVFFALMFLFLSAMYAIVFSNNLSWLFAGWEVTTVCSFLLIGYTKTGEALRSAFRQIIMNLAGGIAFVLALMCSVLFFNTLSLADFVQAAALYSTLAIVPVTCLAFAGITKAAQMPFHTWLLGAMVAPTPTSALLHSSTMVKAGVFMLIKLAPAFTVSVIPAAMTILVGGITFCLASFIAISQSNAKRVLAYSTIANLGLIVACAGVGTPEAVWAAIFLVLFHAIAKSLLFLCVGTAEHHIGSRDIEDEDLLFERLPRLSRLMMLGIMCMFIAPFGMLVSKWAALVSFIDSGQVVLLILLAFGSGATFMFWAKWMGKLAGIAAPQDSLEGSIHRSEWIALATMAVVLVLCCALLPVISDYLVMPYLWTIWGPAVFTNGGNDILWITGILSLAVAWIIFGGLSRRNPKTRQASVYLSGVGLNNTQRTFTNSLSHETASTARNWYLEGIFGETHIAPIGEIACTIIIIAAFAIALATPASLL